MIHLILDLLTILVGLTPDYAWIRFPHFKSSEIKDSDQGNYGKNALNSGHVGCISIWNKSLPRVCDGSCGFGWKSGF